MLHSVPFLKALSLQGRPQSAQNRRAGWDSALIWGENLPSWCMGHSPWPFCGARHRGPPIHGDSRCPMGRNSSSATPMREDVAKIWGHVAQSLIVDITEHHLHNTSGMVGCVSLVVWRPYKRPYKCGWWSDALSSSRKTP